MTPLDDPGGNGPAPVALPPGTGLCARPQFPRPGDPDGTWPLSGDEALEILGGRWPARIREDLKSRDDYPHIALVVVVAPVGEVRGSPLWDLSAVITPSDGADHLISLAEGSAASQQSRLRAACLQAAISLAEAAAPPAAGGPVTAAALRELAGRPVELGFPRSLDGATTLRWGTLRDYTADGSTLIIDDYHDSSGVRGEYPRHRHQGEQVAARSLRFIRPDHRRARP